MAQSVQVHRSPFLVFATVAVLVAVSLTAALALTNRASAQPPALVTTMTATHGSLEPGVLITYTVTITNPDVVERITNEFVFPDPDLTFDPIASPDWVDNGGVMQSQNLTIPAGETRTFPIVMVVGALALDKHAIVSQL